MRRSLMGLLASRGCGTPMATVPETHYVLKENRQVPPFPAGLSKCVFAAGCFWGTEKRFWRMPGVYATSVGYIAGKNKDPTYEEVCSGRTGHTEGCQVVYDPQKVSFSDLLRMFWECHDPTQGNRQGNDRGTQYRSGLYPDAEDQQRLAEASRAAYEAAVGRKITTEMGNPGQHPFYYAEGYHQQYLAKPGARPYCSAQPTGVALPPFASWAPSGMEEHAPKLPEDFWQANCPGVCEILSQPNDPITKL